MARREMNLFFNRLRTTWNALCGRVVAPKIEYVTPEPRWIQILHWQDNLLALDNLGQVWLIRTDFHGQFVVNCPPVLTTPRRY